MSPMIRPMIIQWISGLLMMFMLSQPNGNIPVETRKQKSPSRIACRIVICIVFFSPFSFIEIKYLMLA